MTVAELLTQSMAAHRRALSLRRQRKLGDARGALELARNLRQEAHIADPAHEASAWLEEQRHTPHGRDTHAELTKFYEELLNR